MNLKELGKRVEEICNTQHHSDELICYLIRRQKIDLLIRKGQIESQKNRNSQRGETE